MEFIIYNNTERKTMKNTIKYILVAVIALVMIFPVNSYAGNKDRSGSAGASELLINPWPRGTGWASSNVACVKGLESMFINVAGTAFTKKSEYMFAHTRWFEGSGVSINTFGFTQRAGESGVVGLQIMSMRFGEIEKTTVESPDPSLGSIGTFSPSLLNISVSYSKAFSNSIFGGINMKIVHEAISEVSAQGVAIDAGIMYVTGEQENIKFGISLKNWGPTMKFKGDGMSFRGFIPGQETQFTVEQRSQQYELPAQLNIGAAYDFLFKEGENRLTIAGTFVSNSFSKDNINVGAELNIYEYLYLRAGYTYEDGIFNSDDRTSVYTGPSAGCSIEYPLNKEKGTSVSIDYSYRATNPFSGTHSIGARLNL